MPKTAHVQQDRYLAVVQLAVHVCSYHKRIPATGDARNKKGVDSAAAETPPPSPMHTDRRATTPGSMLGGYELLYGAIYLAETPVANTYVD